MTTPASNHSEDISPRLKSGILRAAAIQSALHWQAPEDNIKRFEAHLNRCPDAGLCVLPEMFTTGFTMDPESWAEPHDGPGISWLKQQAQQRQQTLCASTASHIPLQGAPDYVNRMHWCAPDYYRHYDKRHLFRMAGEHKQYRPGKERVITEIAGFRCLLQVCYDLRFPVFCRNKNDYDVMIVIANWPAARSYAWRQLLIARAIENQCYVIGVNRVGQDGNGHDYSGDSVILDFKGRTLADAPAGEEAVVDACLNLEDLQAFREQFPAHADADDFELKLD